MEFKVGDKVKETEENLVGEIVRINASSEFPFTIKIIEGEYYCSWYGQTRPGLEPESLYMVTWHGVLELIDDSNSYPRIKTTFLEGVEL